MQGVILEKFPFEKRASLSSDEATIISGNALNIVNQQSQLYEYYAYQNPPAVGDTRSWNIFIENGSYNLICVGVSSNSCGMVDWYLDSTKVISGQDWYIGNAGTLNTVISGVIAVPTDGQHKLRVNVTGKNTSSSSYVIPLTKIYLLPSSDL